MKNLIVYASRYGCTADCAKELASLLTTETEVLDIAKQSEIDLKNYDRVIVGSSVYMGQINKKIKKFCEDRKEELMGKVLVLFICSGIPENFRDVIVANFSDDIQEHAIEVAYFGGRLDFSRMTFIDKAIAGLMAKQKGQNKPVVEINEAAIREMAQRLNN